MDCIAITRPDDGHLHLRRKSLLKKVIFYTNDFGRGVVMGNTDPPIETARDVISYRNEIITAAPNFNPVMSFMLTQKTTPEIADAAFNAGAELIKLIPANTSTNSAAGVNLLEIEKFYPVLETVRGKKKIFSLHSELINWRDGTEIPEQEREIAALPLAKKIVKNFPGLKIVFEHLSTRAMINFVEQTTDNVAGSLSVQHAFATYYDVCDANGRIINPYLYGKPIAKTEDDRRAVVKAMISGNPKFYFGSDFAPHEEEKKTKYPPEAGIFSPYNLSLLFFLFKINHELKKMENFISKFWAEFYGYPLNKDKILVTDKYWWADAKPINGLMPFTAGQTRYGKWLLQNS